MYAHLFSMLNEIVRTVSTRNRECQKLTSLRCDQVISLDTMSLTTVVTLKGCICKMCPCPTQPYRLTVDGYLFGHCKSLLPGSCLPQVAQNHLPPERVTGYGGHLATQLMVHMRSQVTSRCIYSVRGMKTR